MSTTTQELTVPTGTLQADPVHSSIGFEVRYMGIAFFKGAVKDFGATWYPLHPNGEKAGE